MMIPRLGSHPKSLQNLIGLTFGSWKVLARLPSRSKSTYWLCECKCGRQKPVKAFELTHEHSLSCGQNECHRAIHRMTNSAEHRVWSGMKGRCRNPNDPAWLDYGGRGITVCDEWNKFENFYRDMGPRPSPEHSIERRDNDKGYSPDNCYWATRQEQALNRRNSTKLTLNGETLNILRWSERLGISESLIYWRLNKGNWSVERTLTTPVKKYVLTRKLSQDEN